MNVVLFQIHFQNNRFCHVVFDAFYHFMSYWNRLLGKRNHFIPYGFWVNMYFLILIKNGHPIKGWGAEDCAYNWRFSPHGGGRCAACGCLSPTTPPPTTSQFRFRNVVAHTGYYGWSHYTLRCDSRACVFVCACARRRKHSLCLHVILLLSRWNVITLLWTVLRVRSFAVRKR